MLNGEEIIYEGKFNWWYPHKNGVVIEKDYKFLLNGYHLIYERGLYSRELCSFGCSPHPRGLVIQEKNKLWLNGKTLLYEGEMKSWRSHPNGVVIQKGEQFLLIIKYFNTE